MTTSGLHLFDGALHEANAWLKATMAHLASEDPQFALAVLRGTLHALRDRIGAGNAVHFGAQLPTLLRGLYYEGWQPEQAPHHERHTAAFVEHVREAVPPGLQFDPEAAARAVFFVVWERLDPGAVIKTMHMLPAELRALWPETAQARARQHEGA